MIPDDSLESSESAESTETAPSPAPRTALVTGSARRVGRAIAAALVANGWQVVVHARDAARAREACEQLGAAGWVAADLMWAEAIDDIVDVVRATFGGGSGLDLLVNSAASFERVNRWEDAGIDGWQRAMAINARAPYLITAALMAQLRISRGLVVNVSDHAGHQHWPSYPIHSASKAALDSLTLSGAAATVEYGVRMVSIAPGTILAPDEWDEERQALERAAGELGTPDELVSTILELADDRARTGEIIVLPGHAPSPVAAASLPL